MNDYKERKYLSATEVAFYLGISVKDVHKLLKSGKLKGFRSASGQYRFDLADVKNLKENIKTLFPVSSETVKKENIISINGTKQIIYIKDSRNMSDIPDNSVHLVITSPPLFQCQTLLPETDRG